MIFNPIAFIISFMKKETQPRTSRLRNIALVGLMAFAGATSCEARTYREIGIDALSKNPCQYVDNMITTQGFPELLGEESYYIAVPYYNAATKMVQISMAERVTTSYLLHSGPNQDSPSVEMINKEGGFPLPGIPILPASHTIYENEVKASGQIVEIEQDGQKSCVLSAHDVVEIK